MEKIELGKIYSNKEICAIFGCGNMGGMRKVNATNSLILITDPSKGIYEDRWDDDTLYYTGMGKRGDQKIDSNQNKTLKNSKENNTAVHLFEVERKTEYIYRGLVELIKEPYCEDQEDVDGNMRRVWVFPLKTSYKFLSGEVLDHKNKKKEEAFKRLTNEELLEKIRSNADKPTSRRSINRTEYERNPAIIELAKRRSKGSCELCEKKAPFENNDKKPYLEVHHIDWLSEGGADILSNVVALCPNCHRKMHVLNKKNDIEKLKEKALKVSVK